MKYDKICGIGAAMITPFYPDGTLDCEALCRNIDYVIAGGADYIVALGTTAETPTLTAEEKQTIIDLTRRHVAGRVPIVIGMGGNNTAELCRQLRAMDTEGISAVLSVTPYYNKPSQEGLYQHYKAVAEASDLTGRALYDYGPRVMPASERLRQLGEVTDTYLSIFMTLGSIGLVLGLLSFAIVVRKNLTRSAEDIRYYRLLGFPTRRIASILYEENIFIPRIAILSGVVGAMIGIGRGWSAVGVWIWIGGVAVVAAMLILVRLFVRLQIEQVLASHDITKTY
jgi:hypothetical protein